MSEYDHESIEPRRDSDANLQNSLDDSINNSIIGKVKSRVSSILPNRLSKWFSPSAKIQNDSMNGSMCGVYNTLPTRRRRRIEVEEEEEAEENYEDDEGGRSCEQYEEGKNMHPKQIQIRDRNVDVMDDNDNDDDSQNSEEEYNNRSMIKTRRDLRECQPPAKKSRLNIEIRNSPVARPQTATGDAYLRNAAITPVTRSTNQKYTYLNLYGNPNKREPAFNFGQQKESISTTKINTDIVDLVTNSNYEDDGKHKEFSNIYNYSRTGNGSRKSLNIPSTSALTGAERVYDTVAHLKRQPLASAKEDFLATNTIDVPARRTSTTLHEVEHQLVGNNEQSQYDNIEKRDAVISDPNSSNYNESIDGCNNSDTNKRLTFINGTVVNNTTIPEASEGILVDSASESGESAMDVSKMNTSNTPQRKTGLFNMSVGGGANTRNSSRTSSFGNGLNFYSHLEGRKSLFSSSHHNNSSLLNNSTLSLTSLNRRQFNASIYGSTSALSDSRLLNTFSPFYKGKTTYGGAAAYNKYTACASSVRITPTLIRPTSRLSSLSSSNNSLAATTNSNVGENSTISSTAKRILDLINDFATPLSEAKKMASNLKSNANSQILPRAKGRLNESDLNASRAIRLSQVRTPYSRPPVILQPSGNASGRGTIGGILPPVKELVVPTMSQLLQMKKMQNTTENVRKIAQNSAISEYKLPDGAENNTQEVTEQDQQKHTNKIRTKKASSVRHSVALKDLQDEKPPPPVNLPNIAFPLMESVPKIDIQINKTLSPIKANSEYTSSKLHSNTESLNTTKVESSKSTSRAFHYSPVHSLTQTSDSAIDVKNDQLSTIQSISTLKSSKCFTFSEPLQVTGVLVPPQSITKNDTEKYKFSPPLDIIATPTSNCFKVYNTHPQQLLLKEGSCLDALSKPFALTPIVSKSNATEQTVPNKDSLNSLPGFGNQFKKAPDEWECNACMIRNKGEINKCVACEAPRKHDSLISSSAPTPAPTSAPAPSFGELFKKSLKEWECGTCLVRNKEEITKCVACEAPREREVPQNTLPLPANHNSFGDAFKPKPGAWECQTCMLSNKSELNECIACQTKKPGYTNVTAASQSAVPATQFKSDSTADCKADVGFKTLATQQKISKWECDACMTRNDTNRSKCACCEQPNPESTSAESSNTSITKFQFGATAASKFSFGFGTGENALKEDALRKQQSDKSDDSEKSQKTQLGLGSSQSVATVGGFQFGVKLPIGTTNECKKDDIDGNKQITGFKFGVSATSADLNARETSAILPPTATGFIIGSNSLTSTSAATTSTAIISSTVAGNATSVKFSSPSTSTGTSDSNADKSKVAALPAFRFGTSTASSTTGGFSFGIEIKTNASTNALDEKKTTDNSGFKTPGITPIKTPDFVFGSSAANNSSTTASASFVSSTSNTTISKGTTTTSTTATEALKPMFSFGTNALTTTASSQASPVFSSFSFGNNSAINTAANSAANTATAAITSTSTTTTTTSATKTSSFSIPSSKTITTASTNIFGSFGGGASSSTSSLTPIFGSSVNSPANNNLATVSSSTNNPILSNTPQFGTFGSKATSNVFGSFGGAGGAEKQNNALANPNGTKPVFGYASQSSQPSPSNSSGFVFGSNTADDKTPTTTALTVGSVTSTSTTWPKSSFVFGSTAAAATSSTNNAAPSTNAMENKEVAKPSIFSTFGSCNSNANNQQQTSIFGVRLPASNIGGSLSTSDANTTSGSASSGTNLFGTNSAPAATSIFGSNSSGNAATPAPAFGSSPFGGAASSTSTTPTFGSTAASGTTFGNFGDSSSITTTNIKDVKKPEAAFSFGAAPTAQSTSGGFNFGSSAVTTKPAFNFGGTSTAQQSTFNFTGSTEPQSSTKLFQFGATPSAPVFNFNRGVLEGTSNAPFQFNAGAAPVSSNIFAPAPTPGTQTAQQAKRKIRAPIRRVTQR